MGPGAVAGTNSHRNVAEPTVLDLATHARLALVHRFAERHERAPRHACFADGERLARLRAGEADPASE